MNWKSFFNRTKIPKDFKRLKGEKIEIRSAQTSLKRILGDPPKYEIRLSHRDNYQPLGYVATRKENGQYEVGRYFHSPGQRAVVVGKFKDLGDANSAAYQTASRIAQKIAKTNKLPLEDLAFEDEQKMEEDELGMKIDSLRDAKLPISLFLVLGGLVLSISSLTQTGNAISDITGTTKGIFGISLLIAGIIGVLLSLKLK